MAGPAGRPGRERQNRLVSKMNLVRLFIGYRFDKQWYKMNRRRPAAVGNIAELLTLGGNAYRRQYDYQKNRLGHQSVFQCSNNPF
jgi:hypothetical protein